MPETPAAERLARLREIHARWSAELEAVGTSDPDLSAAFMQALIDLEALIRQLEAELKAGPSE